MVSEGAWHSYLSGGLVWLSGGGCGLLGGLLFCHEVFVADELHAAIVVLDDGGEALYPVPRIQVADSPDLLVLWGVDVAADDAVTAFLDGEVLEEFFVFIDETDSGFHLPLYALAEGEIFLSAPCSPAVVVSVKGEEGVVAEGSYDCQPLVIGGDAIKAIAMDDEVAELVCGEVDVFFEEADFAEGEGQEAL